MGARSWWLLFSPAVIFGAVFSGVTLALLGSLPDSLATQWNSAREVTSQISIGPLIPVAVTALFLPALICGVVLFLGRAATALPQALRVCGVIAWGLSVFVGVSMIGIVVSQAGRESAEPTSGPPTVWILSGLFAGLVAGVAAVVVFKPSLAPTMAEMSGYDDEWPAHRS